MYEEALDYKIKKKVLKRYSSNRDGYIYRYFEYPTNLLASSIYGVVYTLALTIDFLLVQVFNNWVEITSWVSGFYGSHTVKVNSVALVLGVLILYRLQYNSSFVKVWVEDFTGKDEDIRREIAGIYKGMLQNKKGGETLITYVKELRPQISTKELKGYIESVGYHNKKFLTKLNNYIQEGKINKTSEYADLITNMFTSNYYEEGIKKLSFNKQMGMKDSAELTQFKDFIRQVEAGYIYMGESKSQTTQDAMQLIKQIQGVF